jgi:hypothetical protein
VTSKYFQAYVSHISSMKHKAPTRNDFVETLDELCGLVDTKISNHLTKAPLMGIYQHR